MKRFFGIFGLLVLVFALCIALIPAELPPIPIIERELSPAVNYIFEIHAASGRQVELRHMGKGKPLYLHLQVAGSWTTRRPSLYLNAVGQRARMKGNESEMNPDKGFVRFQKDNRGKSLRSYKFNNTVVEDREGKQYVRMLYQGPDMPMIGSMTLERKLTFPSIISEDLGLKSNIILKPGTYTLDDKEKGFYIELAQKFKNSDGILRLKE